MRGKVEGLPQKWRLEHFFKERYNVNTKRDDVKNIGRLDWDPQN